MTETPPDNETFGDRASSWAISAFGWIIVAVIIYLAIDWLFSTLAMAFKAVLAAAIVGVMIYGYFKLRRTKHKHDKHQQSGTAAA